MVNLRAICAWALVSIVAILLTGCAAPRSQPTATSSSTAPAPVPRMEFVAWYNLTYTTTPSPLGAPEHCLYVPFAPIIEGVEVTAMASSGTGTATEWTLQSGKFNRTGVMTLDGPSMQGALPLNVSVSQEYMMADPWDDPVFRLAPTSTTVQAGQVVPVKLVILAPAFYQGHAYKNDNCV